jgi:hypothetical protein
MSLPDTIEISSPVAAISSNGVLNVLFSSITGNAGSQSLQNNLLLTSRTMEIPEGTPGATQAVAPTSAPTTVIEPSPTPDQPSFPTPIIESDPTPTISLNPTGRGNLFMGTIIGPLIGAILVIIVISGYFFMRSARRR